MNKKIITLAGTVLLSGIMVGVMQANKSNADIEPPIVQEVRHQGEVLDNHEDRITNLESDVTTVQQNTNTSPSPNKVVVREVQTPAPTEPLVPVAPTAKSTPAPAPVTVVAYQPVPIADSENMDCKFTYSDGTTYQWHWKTVEYNQGTKITHTSGKCDASVIGKEKA